MWKLSTKPSVLLALTLLLVTACTAAEMPPEATTPAAPPATATAETGGPIFLHDASGCPIPLR